MLIIVSTFKSDIPMNREQLYHIIVIYIKNNRETKVTGYPMVLSKCQTMISKFTRHSHSIIIPIPLDSDGNYKVNGEVFNDSVI